MVSVTVQKETSNQEYATLKTNKTQKKHMVKTFQMGSKIIYEGCSWPQQFNYT